MEKFQCWTVQINYIKNKYEILKKKSKIYTTEKQMENTSHWMETYWELTQRPQRCLPRYFERLISICYFCFYLRHERHYKTSSFFFFFFVAHLLRLCTDLNEVEFFFSFFFCSLMFKFQAKMQCRWWVMWCFRTTKRWPHTQTAIHKVQPAR